MGEILGIGVTHYPGLIQPDEAMAGLLSRTLDSDQVPEALKDPARWPDPAAMNRELHAMGVGTLLSVWPHFSAGTQFYDMLLSKGWLIHKHFLDRATSMTMDDGRWTMDDNNKIVYRLSSKDHWTRTATTVISSACAAGPR